MYPVCDAPAPAELHGANVHFIHLRGDDAAVTLLDERTGNSAPAEFTRERQADRSTTDDQNGSFLHARAPTRDRCRRDGRTGRSGSFRLDARELHHLGPLPGFRSDEFAEIRRLANKRKGPQPAKSFLLFWLSDPRIDLLVESFNDLRGRAFRGTDAKPTARFEAWHEVVHGRNVRQDLRA